MAAKYSGVAISESAEKPDTLSRKKLLPYGVFGVGVLLGIIGLVLIIVGAIKQSESCTSLGLPVNPSTSPVQPTTPTNQSSFSSEAVRAGLDKLLEEVKTKYYEMSLDSIAFRPKTLIKQVFSPYNCHPEAIKNRTDTTRSLYDKTIRITNQIDRTKLFPRESKALAQVKHFVQSNFGTPYDENYYAGDWMLGPNLWCWQSICYVGSDIKAHFNSKSSGFQPKTVEDVDFVMNHLQLVNDSLTQYIANLKYGIKAGFVRSEEACKSGLFTMKRQFFSVAQNGEEGVLNSSFTKSMRDSKWYASISSASRSSWQQAKGRSIEESIDDALVEHVGRPLHNLLQYLEFNHSKYCVPSNISSGFATLPLDGIYLNGVKTGEITTKVLPTGEKLNGANAYKTMLPFFTTTEMGPEEINDLGQSMLNQLYPQAIAIARKITGLDDSDQAVKAFRRKLDDQSMFFNDQPIPENETNKEAHMKCVDMASAKIHCPTRHASMLKWFEYVNGVLSLLAPKTVKMFHFTGAKRSTPNCPVQVVANFNPSAGYQSYGSSDKSCSRPCRYNLPFYLKNHGPKYNAYSVAAHEARPGHHTQTQGFIELFNDDHDDVISWLNGLGYYSAFIEGWALYTENPIINSETDTYANSPIQKYGMLKWQIWRALRLIVDTGLHYRGLTRHEALELFAKYAWDRTDKAVKEVTRYQSNPGQATAYMIGQLAIWRYRNATTQRLEAENIKFNEKDFHFQVLSQGSSPLSYLESHLEKFTNCTIDSNGSGCNTILNPDFASKRNKYTSSSEVKMQPYADDDDQEGEFFDDVSGSRLRNRRLHREYYD